MNDAESALKHFQAINSLFERLKEIGVAVYEHQYYSLVFGSWTIVAGKRKQRTKFSWDGRDRFLDYSEADFPDSSYSSRDWKHIKNEKVDFKDSLNEYGRMEQYLYEKYSV